MRVAEAPMRSPTDGRRDSTTRGPPALQRAGVLVHQPDLPALLHTSRRRAVDDRPAHRRQRVAHAPAPRARAPHQLPTGSVPRTVVRTGARLRAGPVPARPRHSRRPRDGTRRRHRRWAQGGARPRQGPAPRPGPLHPFVHRLAVRAPLGRLGRPGEVPVRRPPVGTARPHRPVPVRRRRPQALPAAPHTGANRACSCACC